MQIIEMLDISLKKIIVCASSGKICGLTEKGICKVWNGIGVIDVGSDVKEVAGLGEWIVECLVSGEVKMCDFDGKEVQGCGCVAGVTTAVAHGSDPVVCLGSEKGCCHVLRFLAKGTVNGL
jgi:hypothetical protein